MYYLFYAPCTVCSAACSCCSGACAGLNQALGECWEQTFGGIYSSPIGGHVIFTWLAMAATITFSFYSFLELDCENDTSLTNAKNCLMVVMVFGVVHCACILWIQKQVKNKVDELTEKYQEPAAAAEQGTAGAGAVHERVKGGDYVDPKDQHALLQKALWEVIKLDFVFCFYFFYCIASFSLGCYGMTEVTQCIDEDTWGATSGFLGLIFYNCAGGLYFWCVMCRLGCGKGKRAAKTVTKKAKDKTKGKK